ncbi:NADP-dependent oxidoreductase domain-containing protein [Baffinella frigidus]|nr:NADP-dependent oxidoreductase domain-containing protein [Cryptophyta sp. CCMP2293]
MPSMQETWETMEALVDEGLVRAIGVSNVDVAQLCDILTYARHRPSVNQVELHPHLQQRGLVNFCHKVGTQVVAFSPLGRPDQVLIGQEGEDGAVAKKKGGTPLLQEPCVLEVAREAGLSPAQVVLAWGLQRGHGVVPKSSNASRLRENLEAVDARLSEESLRRIDGIEGLLPGGPQRYVNLRLVGEGCGPPFRQWGPTLLQ